MDKPVQDLADRFSQIADQYDDKHGSDEKPIYNACASLVIEHADPRPGDGVLDLGTGTGLIALTLAEDAGHVIGRDISDGMIEQARLKAADRGIENVEFGYGEFRDPQYDGDVDVIVFLRTGRWLRLRFAKRNTRSVSATSVIQSIRCLRISRGTGISMSTNSARYLDNSLPCATNSFRNQRCCTREDRGVMFLCAYRICAQIS